MTEPYDAIVVGSGANGGVAAKRLTEAGARVLVLEAGERVDPPATRLGKLKRLARKAARFAGSSRQRVQSLHPTFWDSDPGVFVDDVDCPYSTPADKPFQWIRCRTLGGRTLAWDGVTPRMSDYELSAAERDGVGIDWPLRHADLDPYYRMLECYLGVHGDRDGLPQVPDGAFHASRPLTAAERTFKKRVESELPDRRVIVSRGLDAGREPRAGERWPLSNVHTTLRDAADTGRATIRTGAVVSRVLTDPMSDRATGVELVDTASGALDVAHAPVIFLCASTLESVRLLLNSRTRAHPDGLGASSGVLGHYVMDHIAGNLFFQLPDVRPSSRTHRLLGSRAFMVPRYRNLDRQDAPYLRGFGMWGAIDRLAFPSVVREFAGEAFGFINTRGEVLPRFENRVEIDPDLEDRWGIPCVRIHCAWGDNDLAVAEAARREAEEMIVAAGGEVRALSRWIRGPLGHPVLDRLESEWRTSTPGLFVHELGGARMGRSPDDSVVDPTGALWDVPNLYVTDGACWPSSGWQNPTLTQMAITARAVDQAFERHG